MVYTGGSLLGLRLRPRRAQEAARRPGVQARRGRDVHEVHEGPEGAVAADAADVRTRACPTGRQLEGPTEVKNFKFASGRADALRYVAKIGAANTSTIPIYLPKTPPAASTGLFLPTVAEVVDIISTAPRAGAADDQARSTSTRAATRSDTYWASQPGYSNVPNFRSYMTAGADGIVDIYPSTSPHNADHGPDQHRARERPHGVAEAVGHEHEQQEVEAVA